MFPCAGFRSLTQRHGSRRDDSISLSVARRVFGSIDKHLLGNPRVLNLFWNGAAIRNKQLNFLLSIIFYWLFVVNNRRCAIVNVDVSSIVIGVRIKLVPSSNVVLLVFHSPVRNASCM